MLRTRNEAQAAIAQLRAEERLFLTAHHAMPLMTATNGGISRIISRMAMRRNPTNSAWKRGVACGKGAAIRTGMDAMNIKAKTNAAYAKHLRRILISVISNSFLP